MKTLIPVIIISMLLFTSCDQSSIDEDIQAIECTRECYVSAFSSEKHDYSMTSTEKWGHLYDVILGREICEDDYEEQMMKYAVTRPHINNIGDTLWWYMDTLVCPF